MCLLQWKLTVFASTSLMSLKTLKLLLNASLWYVGSRSSQEVIVWARNCRGKEGIAQANFFFLQPPALRVHFLWTWNTIFPKPNIHEKVNDTLYLQWKSSVHVSVMVQDHIIGHVKALSDPQMVKEGRLSGDITHVHHGNIWDDKDGTQWSVCCIYFPPNTNRELLQFVFLPTVS